jgi:glycosyltransferase involved in cell wall biosynthesis
VIPIPNFLTRASLAAPRRKHDGTVLGYIGWVDHQDDWDALGLQEIVEDLLDVHHDLRVESVGPIDLRLPRDCYTSRGALPFDQLPQAIAGFDVAIAPLIDKLGNDTRSDIKLKEYAIAGVPWLASPYGPYVDFGEEQGGWLVEDDRWRDALNAMLSDGKARKKLAKRGQKWAKDQTLERNAPLWIGAFEEAMALAEERGAAVR